MNALATTHPAGPVPATLSERLDWLRRFGKPRVGVYGANWHAHIEMNTTAQGASFEVRSDHDHPTPDEAVDTLIARMRAALAALGVVA